MGKEPTRSAETRTDGSSAGRPALDQSTMQTERRATTDRLLARLKALDGSSGTLTARAYAGRYVREQESLLLRLLGSGVGIDEILTDLAVSFPSIPASDWRRAIAQLRDRRRKYLAASATLPEVAPARTMPSDAQDTPDPEPATPANTADRRPDETEEDYRLRKALEAPSDLRPRFIGES